MPANEPMAVQRGDYGSSPFTKGFFVLVRLVSGPLQYALITTQPLMRVGIPPPPTGGLIRVLGRDYLRLPFLTALMPAVLSVKQALWATCWSRERLTPSLAVFTLCVEVGLEVTHTLVFCAASANPMFSERQFYIGMAIFMAAVAMEFVAELQRAAFKARPENKGKLCTTGFWAIVRHINYTANVLFGFGAGLAAGGWPYAIIAAGIHLGNFITTAIPGMEAYMRPKYGKQWTAYEKKVPWRLIPGIY